MSRYKVTAIDAIMKINAARSFCKKLDKHDKELVRGEVHDLMRYLDND